MLDLIGYWSAVTFYSVTLLAIPFAVFYLLATLVICNGIPDSKDASKVFNWMFKDVRNNFCNHWVLLGGRSDMPCCVHILTLLISLCIWLGVIVGLVDHDAESLVALVNDWSVGSGGFFSVVGITTVMMLLIHIATKYIYKAIKLSAQVKEHMDNTKIHVVD